MAEQILTQKYLHSIFDYKDGMLYWKISPAKNVKEGMRAGHVSKNGYERIKFNKNLYFSHRLIFLMHYGYFPKEIDHIDGNPSNNNIGNLRSCNHLSNMKNTKIQKNNTSGIKGVSWHKSTNKWRVQIGVDGKVKHIGTFDDLELAKTVAIDMRNKFHGNFARHE